MARFYRSREGEATLPDTKTQLVTLGSETAPGPLLVPAGVSKLVGIIAAAVGYQIAAGSVGIFCRLEGAGLPEGPEVIAIGAHGYNIVTGCQALIEATRIGLDIPVTPGNEILIFLEMTDVDIGQVSGGVTLIFE